VSWDWLGIKFVAFATLFLLAVGRADSNRKLFPYSWSSRLLFLMCGQSEWILAVTLLERLASVQEIHTRAISSRLLTTAVPVVVSNLSVFDFLPYPFEFFSYHSRGRGGGCGVCHFILLAVGRAGSSRQQFPYSWSSRLFFQMVNLFF
ncbi:hypothetical protein J6590_074725, partial [Homalodisca vitripennis]